VRWLKARMMGRIGPHPLQPWRDLLKLLRKRPVLAENASWISRAAPYLAVAAAVAALALVPSFSRAMLFAPMSDLLLIAGLLALGRVALALAGMDVGTAFGGLGAAREMSFAALAEPALLLAALSFAILAGSTGLEQIAATFQEGAVGLRVSLALALIALCAVAVAENARIPVDNPATHLELTMVHEAMILEASGRHLALWEAAAALRLTLWLALIVAVFLPFGTAPAGLGAGCGGVDREDGAAVRRAGRLRERHRQDARLPRAGVPGGRAAAGAAGRDPAVRVHEAGVTAPCLTWRFAQHTGAADAAARRPRAA
jgi:formate hydrogenlyase subunit 4